VAAPVAPGMARLDSRDAAHAWLVVRGARALVSDSRSVAPGDAFVAWPGRASDGRRYVAAALAAGASACLVEADGVEGFGLEREPRVAALHGLKAAAGDIASRRSEEHTSELQSRENLVCRLLLEKKKKTKKNILSQDS